MPRRQNVLLSLLGVMSAVVPSSQSDSLLTLTIPTFYETVSSLESIITSTLVNDGISVFTTTARGRERVETTALEGEVITSTVTGESTILVPTQTVIVTAVDAPIDIESVALPTADTTGTPTTGSSSSQVMSAAPSSAAPNAQTPTPNTSIYVTTEDEEPDSGKSGLSAGSKAGIAIGTILGTVLLASMAYFCLKARSEARPRSSTLDLYSKSSVEDNYSPTIASEKQMELAQTQSKTEDTSQQPEDMTHPAYVANPRFSDNMNLTGIVFEEKKEAPMYIGVPSHMTGVKRWSAPGPDKQF